MSFLISFLAVSSLVQPSENICSNKTILGDLKEVYKAEVENICEAPGGYKPGVFYIDLGGVLMPLPNRFVLKLGVKGKYLFNGLEYDKLGLSVGVPSGEIQVLKEAINIEDVSAKEMFPYQSFGLDYYRALCESDLEVHQVIIQVTEKFVPTFQIFTMNGNQFIYRDSNPYLLDAILISTADINCKSLNGTDD